MGVSSCNLVDLALDAGDFPDRDSVMALLQRLRAVGRIEWVAIVLGPRGGGRVKFLVHDAASVCDVRTGVEALVGEKSIRAISERAGPAA
jgi:hypothetical protein